MPMNFDGSFHSSASELIGSVEVLEAKIAPSRSSGCALA
ncbi:Uncharacterised protein [Mycobacterium tuberculosis]|nr:Uncharacterised protein [Mycobacterium tuberculosis]